VPNRNLFLIRTALMTGVFLFAAVAYFGPRIGMNPQIDFSALEGNLRYVLWAFMAIAVAGASLLRPRVESAHPAKQAQYLIIGWALGEAAALFGIVMFMGGAGLTPMSLGLLTFVFTLVLLPIPRVRR
jgi:hypothetical protein